MTKKNELKKRRYFVSYSFIDKSGINQFDNCSVTIEEEKVIFEDIEEELNGQKESQSVKILFFTELKDSEMLEKE